MSYTTRLFVYIHTIHLIVPPPSLVAENCNNPSLMTVSPKSVTFGIPLSDINIFACVTVLSTVLIYNIIVDILLLGLHVSLHNPLVQHTCSHTTKTKYNSPTPSYVATQPPSLFERTVHLYESAAIQKRKDLSYQVVPIYFGMLVHYCDNAPLLHPLRYHRQLAFE
jgi:hypothetical protein